MDSPQKDIPLNLEIITNMPSSSGMLSSAAPISESESEDYTDNSEGENTSKDFKLPSKKKLKQFSKLNPNLKGLIGEANLRVARGDFENAKKMCFEVIRQSAECYEPYLTLAQIYENTNSKKYKAYLMLASHLHPNDASIRCRLAEISLQEGLVDEAIYYYRQAIVADPRDMKLHRRLLALLEQIDDQKGILKCKQTMAKYISRKQYETISKICMEVAKEYYANKNYFAAIYTLKIPLKRIPDKVTEDLLNMILELLIFSSRFSECLDIFTQFSGFAFDVTVEDDNTFTINSYSMPEKLKIDLKVKFMICLIRLRCYHLISHLIDELLINNDVEIFGDLYIDLVEALMASAYYEEALKLTVPLIKSNRFSLAAIWLKHAECLNECGMFEQAIDAYYTVKQLAPNHVEVLYPLAMLLLEHNRKDEALEALAQDLSNNRINVAVLIEQMKLLKQIGDLNSYWKCCELLLSRHCIVLKNIEELKVVMHASPTFKEKVMKITEIRSILGQDLNVEPTVESIKEPTVEEEYKLYREILQFAFNQKEYYILQKLAFMGLASKRFLKYFEEISLVASYSCIHTKDVYHGFSGIREIVSRHPQNHLAWNWLSVICQMPEETRHIKFIDRLDERVYKYKNFVKANYYMYTANHVDCLKFFVEEYRKKPTSYSALVLGICMSQMYCQRQIDKDLKKKMAETVTYLFLKYAKIRSKHAKHEAFYNLGRMYQLLGVNYLAEYYYKRVLKEDTEWSLKYPDTLGLKEEAAYNLHLIYKASGNFEAARNIVLKYIVI